MGRPPRPASSSTPRRTLCAAAGRTVRDAAPGAGCEVSDPASGCSSPPAGPLGPAAHPLCERQHRHPPGLGGRPPRVLHDHDVVPRVARCAQVRVDPKPARVHPHLDQPVPEPREHPLGGVRHARRVGEQGELVVVVGEGGKAGAADPPPPARGRRRPCRAPAQVEGVQPALPGVLVTPPQDARRGRSPRQGPP